MKSSLTNIHCTHLKRIQPWPLHLQRCLQTQTFARFSFLTIKFTSNLSFANKRSRRTRSCNVEQQGNMLAAASHPSLPIEQPRFVSGSRISVRAQRLSPQCARRSAAPQRLAAAHPADPGCGNAERVPTAPARTYPRAPLPLTSAWARPAGWACPHSLTAHLALTDQPGVRGAGGYARGWGEGLGGCTEDSRERSGGASTAR